jgi:magnesium-transporting ATPase (P-type)
MRIDEAVLTGESGAVDKRSEPVDVHSDLGDRSSMAFSGTLVTFGQGRGVVVGTGADDRDRPHRHMLGEVETLTTPLLRDVAVFGRWLSAAIVVLAAATFAFGLWVRDYDVMEMFLAPSASPWPPSPRACPPS